MGSANSKQVEQPSGGVSASNGAGVASTNISENSFGSATEKVMQNKQEQQQEQESKCPMHKGDGSYSYDWFALFRKDFPHGPTGSKPIEKEEAIKKVQGSNANINDSDSGGGGCPVKHSRGGGGVEYNVYGQKIDPNNQMPSNPNQLPAPNQTIPLSTERVASTIPKGGGGTTNTTWTYPSPQMFYNALARKGKLDTDNNNNEQEDMDSVVALHNNMNEKTWKNVQKWEAVYGNDDIKLLKFQGRPYDLSPKAAFKHYILQHPLPFDRHDWIIERSDGTTVRYVIDYYHDETLASDTIESAKPNLHEHDAVKSLLVDVRPAADTVSSIILRTIQMPYARNVTKTTSFQPLSMIPSSTMKTNYNESIQVWKNIQNRRKEKKLEEQQEQLVENNMKISEKEMNELMKKFNTILSNCNKQQVAVSNCNNDNECAKASIDLDICMGNILCPLQHTTLINTLNNNDNNNDNAIDEALSRMNQCIQQQTIKYKIIKQQKQEE